MFGEARRSHVRYGTTAVLVFGIGLLASLGWTETSSAQAKIPRVGILMIDGVPQWLEPFQHALRDQGWVEGQKVPVEELSTLKLSVNLRTARAMGITIPDSILARADELVR